MARKSKNLPFEEAKEFIRSQAIGSKKQYALWHDLNKPRQIPKYPNRAYSKQWEGWNDWLGTDNKFDSSKRVYRPFAEAIVWAHKIDVWTKEEWTDFVRGRVNLPDDIPTRPDLIYEEWKSWPHFLGSKPQEKVEAQRQVLKDAALFYVIQEREYMHQNTVFTFGVEKEGRLALKDKWEMARFRLIRMFRYDEEQMNHVWRVIKAKSSPFYGAEDVRIVPNINELVWDINAYLEIVP